MRWRSVLTVAVAVGLLPGLTVAQDTRPGIAVLPFEDGGSYGEDKEDFQALTIGLQQMLITEFAANGSLRVVDRSRIKEILEELELGTSGKIDAQTAARVGELVGARYMVMGGFVDWFGDMRIDTRIVNVETSEVEKVERRRDDRAKLFSMVVDLADGITKDLDLPPLPRGQARERQQRSERIDHEAVQLYMKALFYADRGQTDRAVELFNQVTTRFPDYTEAQEALRQIQRGP